MATRIHIALCCLALCLDLHAQQKETLAVRRMSPSTLRIELRPEFVQSSVWTGEGKAYSALTFYGARFPEGAPGSVMLPYRAIPVSLPGNLTDVRVVESSSRTLNSGVLVPYPRLEPDKEFGAAFLFDFKGGVDRKSAIPPLAEIVDLIPSGSGFTGTLLIRPVAIGKEGGVVLYDRIVITIETGGGHTPGPAPTTHALNRASNPLGSGEWYAMNVREIGIYKLDFSFLLRSGISTSSIGAISSIRIFGNNGEMLPENIADSRIDGLREIQRHVVDKNGNGIFDQEDYVLFYGHGPNGWKYNPALKTFSHWINYYTNSNLYFMTFGGSNGTAMDSTVSSISANPYQPTDFQEMLYVEEERNNLLNSGRQWFGQLFDSETRTGAYSNLLQGYVSAKPAWYRVTVLARSPESGSFLLQENGEPPLGSPIFTGAVNVSSIEVEFAYKSPAVTFTRTGSLPGDRSVVRLTFDNAGSGARGWLDWLEILYRRRYEAVNDFLHFSSPDTTALVRYSISGLSSREVMVFDVTDDAAERITGLSFNPLDPGECAFEMQDSSGAVREYVVVGQNGFKTLAAASRVGNTHLHGITGGAEMVIVTPKEFRGEADRLASHRMQHDSLSLLVVDIEDVYNEYSGGLPDPLAVRDFLVAANLNWTTKPRYVLLFGNGHYDYKNIRNPARNWILPYESLESIHQILSYVSDDVLARLVQGDSRVTVGIGRLPAKSLKEARSMVDKVISYETSAPLDPWRNRVLYVADDGLTSTRDEGNIHTNQAEVLAQYYTPASVEKRKIYIVEFPTVNSSSGRRKPAANVAIIDAMNRGSLIVNYTGHGNPQLWAHEAIFTRETSLPQLTNKDRLFLLVAATCDFARYDNPDEESAGEQILTMSQGGAIGVVTASRAVYSFENSQFNNDLYSNLFVRDSLGRPPRLGDAMYQTKQAHFSTNDLKYHLFADPSMRLNLPPPVAGLDSVNGMPAAGTVAVQALSRVGVAGEIRNPDNSLRTEFTGQAVLEMFDSKRRVPVPEWGNYTFEVNGSLLYRGLVTVANGVFRATVPIPKDVSYDNDKARISVYAWSGNDDAIGFTEAVTIAGTDSSAAIDTTGPLVEVFLQDEAFRSGDVVPSNPLLIARLYDQSGINTSTASVGHRMEAILSRTAQTLDLTDFYRGDVDTYQSGRVQYTFRDLPEGRQSVTIKAWDIYNNSTQTAVSFDVKLVSDLSMYQVFNFPNPVSRSTIFTFQRNSTEPIEVRVKIFTVAGRLVDEIEAHSVLDRFVQIPWDARDRNGDALANGVYFYKIITSSSDRRLSMEAMGKLTMLR